MKDLTNIEKEFLEAEAKKIKGLDYLKEIAKRHDALYPDSEDPEEKKRILEVNNQRRKDTIKAIKLVSRVEIKIREEKVYEPNKETLPLEHGVEINIICKSSEPKDELFVKQILGKGVQFFLKFTIEEILQDRLNNYREQSKKKIDKFKKSLHLSEQILKTTTKDSNLKDLFSELEEDTKEDLEKENIEISRELFSGINLTASEMKLQDVFSLLLEQQSQTKDPNKQNYYTGIEGKKQSSFLGGKGTISPGVEFSLYTITKEYLGGKTPSGKEQENVKNILLKLEKKKFLIHYTETYTNKKDGSKTTIKREGYRALFHLDKITYNSEDKDGNPKKNGLTYIVVLSHLFTKQIETKYMQQPVNIIQQLTIANGSPDIPLATMRLKEYLFTIIIKNVEHKITARKLYEKLEPKLMERPRLQLAKDNTIKAIETLIRLGLIIRYEIGKSQVGEDMYIFYLNKNYL